MDIEGIRPPARKHTHRTNTIHTVGSGQVQRTTAAARLQPERVVTPLAEPKQFPLPRYYAPERPLKVTRKHFLRKATIMKIASACTVLVLLTGGFLSWRAYVNLHKVFRGTGTVAALTGKPVAPELLKGEGSGRVNILLLGVGGPGHDGADLTDTIVVLSVDPVNNTATMLSIPRDLWVKQPVNYFGAKQKINAAYESGKYRYLGKMDASNANANAVEAGFASIDQVVQNVTGLTIHYHTLVNFQAFRQAVDSVGGVTVNVPTALVDPTMAWENHWNATLAPAGVQQMDGVKALMYARSRETSSDFARAERQRQILVALKDKVLTAGTLSNPTKIDGLMNALGDNVYSDMSTQGASRLISIMQKVGDSKIKSVGLGDSTNKLLTTDHVGSISVVRPIAGYDSYAAIQSFVRSALPDGYLVKENAPIAVVSTTDAAAKLTGDMLKTYGYSIVSTGAGAARGQPGVVVDLSGGKSPYTKHYLEERYHTKAVTKLLAGVNIADSTVKFVIIGE